MSDLRSIQLLMDYRARIDKARAGSKAELQWLREFIAEPTVDLPVELVLELSDCIADFREREMQREADAN